VGRVSVIEVFSEGIDEALQGIGSDPYSGMNAMGLRVPTLATPNMQSRYLFNACCIEMPENSRGCITGIRTFSSLGVRQGTSPAVVVEQEIVTPGFSLPDGNVSWHLRRVPLTVELSKGPSDLDSFKMVMSKGPALLYQTAEVVGSFYTALSSYSPPAGGRPPGDPVGGLGTFHDLRFPWRLGWHNPNIPIEGPALYMLAASVRQSAGTFAGPAFNAAMPTPGMQPEIAFIANFGGQKSSTNTGVLIWRIAGALRVEVEEC
jgi:hypothetical protein